MSRFRGRQNNQFSFHHLTMEAVAVGKLFERLPRHLTGARRHKLILDANRD
jgi:hypothetical protein